MRGIFSFKGAKVDAGWDFSMPALPPPLGAPPGSGAPPGMMPGMGGARPPMPGGPGGPRSPVLGGGGPGGSPMVAPGRGAGNQASAAGRVSRAFDILKTVFMSFPNGSKEQAAVMKALQALNPLFGTDKAAETGQAANRQMAQMGPQPNPALAGTPSPGPQLAPLPPRQIGQAMGPPGVAG
jgi:hypothetical protein